MEEYEIIWRGPFIWDEVMETEGEVYEEAIYAIAWLPPQRKHKTLYICIAYDQYIKKRLKNNHSADLVSGNSVERNQLVIFLEVLS